MWCNIWMSCSLLKFHFRRLKNNTIEIGMSGQILILMNLWFSISNETLVWLRLVHGPFRWTSPKLSRDNLFIKNFKEPDSQRSCDSMGSDSWHGSQEEESTSKCLFLFGTSGKIHGFLVVKYFFFILGVGKSSLVYACARQFNFTVMEVHAGENRNGTALRKGSKFLIDGLVLAGPFDQLPCERQI